MTESNGPRRKRPLLFALNVASIAIWWSFGHALPSVPPLVLRRTLSTALGVLTPLGLFGSPVLSLDSKVNAAAPSTWDAEVDCKTPGAAFDSITAALKAAPEEARAIRIVLRPGEYRERVVLRRGKEVTIEASPAGEATIVWETQKPYESVLEGGPGSRGVFRGLRFRHASKSVANNYAVYSAGGNLRLEDCDVTTSTGAGVAAEGGQITLSGCKVHDCARQGLVLLGPLGALDELKATVCSTSFTKNGQYLGDGDAIRGPFDGILARNGVEAELRNVTVQDSGAAGISVFEDVNMKVSGGVIKGNAGGKSRTQNGGELIFSELKGTAVC